MKKIILMVLILMVLFPTIQAKKSEDFIVYASNFIFEECKDSDINIKYGVSTTTGSINRFPKGEYNLVDVYNLLRIISNSEPYTTHFESNSGEVSISGNQDGMNLLTCRDNKLDVNGLDYYWNDLRLEVPTNINNIVLQNNGNLIQGLSVCNAQQTQIQADLDNCTIEINKKEQENFWLQFIYPAIMALILSIISYLIIFRKSTKKEYLKKAVGVLLIFLIASYIVSWILPKIIA